MSGLALLSPGAIFASDYRVIRPLREGGMGAVYAVEQLSTSRPCALKVMQPALVNHPDARKRFLREAKIGAQLKSDFVVQVIQAGVDDATGMPWLAMELLEGEDLDAYANRVGRLDAKDVLEIFDQLCDALGEAHGKGIVHRDLKPENIFLAPPRRRRDRFTIKVLDFGIARLLSEAQTTSSRTQGAMGTPLFMAPEQAQPGMSIGPFTDVWALGLIAFRLLTGSHYWRTARDPNATMVMLTMEAYVHPMAVASTRAGESGSAGALPPGFDGWFLRCVARNSAERFPDAAHAFMAFEQLVPRRQSAAQPEINNPLHTNTAPSFPAADAFLQPATPARTSAPISAHPELTVLGPAGTPPPTGIARTVGIPNTRGAPRRMLAIAGVSTAIAAGILAAAVISLQRPDTAPATNGPGVAASAPEGALQGSTGLPSTEASRPTAVTSAATSTTPPTTPNRVVSATSAVPTSPKANPEPIVTPSVAPPPLPSASVTATATTSSTAISGDFDKQAATTSLAAAAGAAKGCKQADGPTGSASVRVVFSPSGNVTSAHVQGPPFAGTSVGGCIASAFRGAHVPPFNGSPVAVSKTVTIN